MAGKQLSGIHSKPLKSDLSAEFLEKANSGEKKVVRATLFVKKSTLKSFNYEKLSKLREKRDFLESIEGGQYKNSGNCVFWQKNI